MISIYFLTEQNSREDQFQTCKARVPSCGYIGHCYAADNQQFAAENCRNSFNMRGEVIKKFRYRKNFKNWR